MPVYNAEALAIRYLQEMPAREPAVVENQTEPTMAELVEAFAERGHRLEVGSDRYRGSFASASGEVEHGHTCKIAALRLAEKLGLDLPWTVEGGE